MASTRPTFRLFQASRAAFRPILRRPAARRFQATDAAPAPQQSLGARLWNSPVGVKTVHFWAPVMKWALVLAGVSDFYRPAESLSMTQNAALLCTGAIWTRWCFVIRPQNLLLAAVNFFLGCVGAVQVGRILNYRSKAKNTSLIEELEGAGKEAAGTAEGIAKNPESATKKAIN
ncbi:MAG: hypothetical protein M1819_004128 [Sarea resinae]|nr:MAG: hypothetical protein M1819_004128 [Sarea resinae]